MILWPHIDVWKFDTDAVLFREIQCKKMDILMFKQCFQWGLDWNQVKYARIMITRVFQCINFCRVPRTMFEHSA